MSYLLLHIISALQINKSSTNNEPIAEFLLGFSPLAYKNTKIIIISKIVIRALKINISIKLPPYFKTKNRLRKNARISVQSFISHNSFQDFLRNFMPRLEWKPVQFLLIHRAFYTCKECVIVIFIFFEMNVQNEYSVLY